MCHACGRRGAGTSLFNLSCSGSSSECQWRVLINSCGGGAGMRERERERLQSGASACCVSPGVTIGARSEVRSVKCELPGPAPAETGPWAVTSGEWVELWRAESVRDRDQRRRQRHTSILVCHQYRVRLLWKVLWHNNRYFVCGAVFFILLRAQADWIVLIEFLVQLFPEIDSDI